MSKTILKMLVDSILKNAEIKRDTEYQETDSSYDVPDLETLSTQSSENDNLTDSYRPSCYDEDGHPALRTSTSSVFYLRQGSRNIFVVFFSEYAKTKLKSYYIKSTHVLWFRKYPEHKRIGPA